MRRVSASRSTASSSRCSSAMRSRMLRRSSSSAVSPAPLPPTPPRWRSAPACASRRRGAMYASRAISTCMRASRVRAWRWKIDRITIDAVEHLRAGRALQVAHLRRREVVVDEHDAGSGRIGRGSFPAAVSFGVRVVLIVVAAWRGVLGHDAAAAGVRGQLFQLTVPEHAGVGERAAALRDAADAREPERVGEALQLAQGGLEGLVADVGKLDRDHHRLRLGFLALVKQLVRHSRRN